MKIMPLFILLMLCSARNSYSNNENQNPFANKFFIGAFNGPPKNHLTQKEIDGIAEAGIDVIIANGNQEYHLSLFKYAEKSGVKVVPMESRCAPVLADTKKLNAIIKEIVTDFSKKQALLAYGIYDEPAANLFPALALCSKMFMKADSIHPPLINLLPSYGSPIQLGAPNFRAYVHEFIKKVNPVVLSYDYYPFREGYTLFDGWHNDLKIVREESRAANIPFWIFVQSEGITGGLKVPTREEIFWQANTALAYGARGILWFCYWTPPYYPKSRMHEKHYSAMIDIKGKKTSVYNHVKEVNLFLHKAGRQLADWDNKYIVTYKSGKLIDGKSPVGSPKGKNFDLVIGTFVKEDKIRIVLSNNSFTKKTVFTFTPAKSFEFVKIVEKFHSKYLKNNKIEIEPGGCIVLEYLKTNNK